MHTSKMICILPLAIFILLSSCRPLLAETIYFFGKIGNVPVGGHLERVETVVSGWYFYYSNARMIRLEGKIDPQGSFQIEESVDYKKTGIFKGNVNQGKWTGTWQKPAGGASLPFLLQENHDLLKNLKGEYRCAAQERDAKFHYTYKWELTLNIVDGVVKRFESTQGSYGDNKDEQTCFIDLKDLEQVPSEAGILLQVKAEETQGEEAKPQTKSQDSKGKDSKPEEAKPEEAKSDGSGADGATAEEAKSNDSKADEAESDEAGDEEQRCTIRILGDGDILWIRFGESGGSDICRNTGSAMFCSPRAFWNDLFVDRRTQKCKALK